MVSCGDGGETSTASDPVLDEEKALEERIRKAKFLKRPPPRRLPVVPCKVATLSASTSDKGSLCATSTSLPTTENPPRIPTPPSSPPSFTAPHDPNVSRDESCDAGLGASGALSIDIDDSVHSLPSVYADRSPIPSEVSSVEYKYDVDAGAAAIDASESAVEPCVEIFRFDEEGTQASSKTSEESEDSGFSGSSGSAQISGLNFSCLPDEKPSLDETGVGEPRNVVIDDYSSDENEPLIAFIPAARETPQKNSRKRSASINAQDIKKEDSEEFSKNVDMKPAVEEEDLDMHPFDVDDDSPLQAGKVDCSDLADNPVFSCPELEALLAAHKPEDNIDATIEPPRGPIGQFPQPATQRQPPICVPILCIRDILNNLHPDMPNSKRTCFLPAQRSRSPTPVFLRQAGAGSSFSQACSSAPSTSGGASECTREYSSGRMGGSRMGASRMNGGSRSGGQRVSVAGSPSSGKQCYVGDSPGQDDSLSHASSSQSSDTPSKTPTTGSHSGLAPLRLKIRLPSRSESSPSAANEPTRESMQVSKKKAQRSPRSGPQKETMTPSPSASQSLQPLSCDVEDDDDIQIVGEVRSSAPSTSSNTCSPRFLQTPMPQRRMAAPSGLYQPHALQQQPVTIRVERPVLLQQLLHPIATDRVPNQLERDYIGELVGLIGMTEIDITRPGWCMGLIQEADGCIGRLNALLDKQGGDIARLMNRKRQLEGALGVAQPPIKYHRFVARNGELVKVSAEMLARRASLPQQSTRTPAPSYQHYEPHSPASVSFSNLPVSRTLLSPSSSSFTVNPQFNGMWQSSTDMRTPYSSLTRY